MLSQAQLERKVEVFTTNGKKPEAQTVIGKVGYGPAKLDEQATLLGDIRLGHAAVPAALKVQKQATAAEAAAREAANQAVVSLSDTGRIVFAGDEPTLTALGLSTRYETIKGLPAWPNPGRVTALRNAEGARRPTDRYGGGPPVRIHRRSDQALAGPGGRGGRAAAR